MNSRFERMLLYIILSIIVITGVICIVINEANSEEAYETAYILCTPNDVVNIRNKPSRSSEVIGRFECGEKVYLDGKQKNGYLRCVNVGLEENTGWVHKGYVVYDKPEYLNQNATIVSKGRLAARKYVGGRRTRWLRPLATVKIWYWSDDWCVTNCGYIQSKYLELEGE